MIDKTRLKEIESLDLHGGSGEDLKQACVMQMVSYVAGEKWTDHPECACPILTTYAIKLNDAMNKESRQLLKPIIPLLVDTQSNDALRIKRKQFFMFRNVTVTYPLLLDLIKMSVVSEKLRALKNCNEDMKIAAAILLKNKEVIRKAANADAYVDAYAYAYANAYADADANAYVDAYAYAYANAYADADANAYVDAYAYANANAYAYAYSDANANTHVYSDANANTHVYSDANAYRKKVAEACVETLRLACAIQGEL